MIGPVKRKDRMMEILWGLISLVVGFFLIMMAYLLAAKSDCCKKGIKKKFYYGVAFACLLFVLIVL
jgi:uncharacterized membrane protein